MTIIEFFDKAAIDNLASTLLLSPERVIFVGDSRKKMERAMADYAAVLREKGIESELCYRTVGKGNLQNIVKELEDLVSENPDCVFDLTGGEDLYLVAMGMVAGRMPGGVRCHRFRIRDGRLQDTDADGALLATGEVQLSVSDLIRMHGGRVVREGAISTYPWDLSESFLSDVESMWNICRKNTRLWNSHAATLGKIVEVFSMPDACTVSYDRATAEEVLRARGMRYVSAAWILYELEKAGVIFGLTVGETVSFSCRDTQVRRCLTVAGQILELAVAAELLALRDADGAPLYRDVEVGVVVDWDDEGADEIDTAVQTVNEIDIIAMKGAIPVFISCKNGDFDVNELYKLDAVATRFGGAYAKRVLVCADMDRMGDRATHLRARMEDMAIRRVEDIADTPDEEVTRILRSLWSN